MITEDVETVVALIETPRTEEEMEALKEKPEGASLEGIEVVGKKKEEIAEGEDVESKTEAKAPKGENAKTGEKK